MLTEYKILFYILCVLGLVFAFAGLHLKNKNATPYSFVSLMFSLLFFIFAGLVAYDYHLKSTSTGTYRLECEDFTVEDKFTMMPDSTVKKTYIIYYSK